MITAQDFGDYTLADDAIIDVQTITDAMMTTGQSLTELGIRFFLNLLVCWILVQFFYYRKSRRRDYYFTFMVFSSAMLMLLYMMGSVEVGVGLTLGLFAIFGVIRYRTETVPVREMTYLFVIIALAAMNGLAPVYKLVGAASANPHYVLSGGSVGIMALSNLLVILLIWVLENGHLLKHTSTKLVKVNNVEVGHVDFLKDAAFVKVFYDLEKGQSGSIDTLTKAKDFVEQ